MYFCTDERCLRLTLRYVLSFFLKVVFVPRSTIALVIAGGKINQNFQLSTVQSCKLHSSPDDIYIIIYIFLVYVNQTSVKEEG